VIVDKAELCYDLFGDLLLIQRWGGLGNRLNGQLKLFLIYLPEWHGSMRLIGSAGKEKILIIG